MNPTLNRKYFYGYGYTTDRAIIYRGVMNKIFNLFIILLLFAAVEWYVIGAYPPLGLMLMVGGFILGFVFALITIFMKKYAAVTAPVYAAAEGISLAGISIIFESIYPGIVFQAVLLTFAVFLIMYLLYRTGIIRVTQRYIMIVAAATGAILVLYILSFILSFLGYGIPYIHSNGLIGIGFSLLVVGVAAANLAVDFHMIERYSERDLPSYMQWYAAFGLMVTLVWLYIEILRLLAKLRSRD